MLARMKWGVWVVTTVVAVALATGALLLLRYRPTREFAFATGRENGAYYALAVEYRTRLAARGYTLTIVPTSGSIEILEQLRDGKAVAGFVQGGTAQAVDTSGLSSLGSILYEPLWVFYRKDAFAEPPTYVTELRGRRIAVGEPGSGSALLARQLLAENGVTTETSHLLPIGVAPAQELLHQGELDALVFVLSPLAPTVRTLLTDSSVALLDIKRTLTYHRHFPYLTTVILPEGSIDLSANIPDRNRVLLATTTSLVARNDIAPDITRLLLGEAQAIHSSGGILQDAGEFPSTRLVEIPMNRDASRFLDVGPTGLERYLPYWLSSRLEWFIFVILPLLVVLYSLFRYLPKVSNTYFRYQLHRRYVEVRKLERQIPTLTVGEIDKEIEWLEGLQMLLTNNLRVPTFCLQEFYNLRAHLNMVTLRLEKRRQLLLTQTETAQEEDAQTEVAGTNNTITAPGNSAPQVNPTVAEWIE